MMMTDCRTRVRDARALKCVWNFGTPSFVRSRARETREVSPSARDDDDDDDDDDDRADGSSGCRRATMGAYDAADADVRDADGDVSDDGASGVLVVVRRRLVRLLVRRFRDGRPGVGQSHGESVEDERGDRGRGEVRQSHRWDVANDRGRRGRRLRVRGRSDECKRTKNIRRRALDEIRARAGRRDALRRGVSEIRITQPVQGAGEVRDVRGRDDALSGRDA